MIICLELVYANVDLKGLFSFAVKVIFRRSNAFQNYKNAAKKLFLLFITKYMCYVM